MSLSQRAEMFLPEQGPAYFSKAEGCRVWDLDGREYIDMSIMGVGNNILGYGHPEVDADARCWKHVHLQLYEAACRSYLAASRWPEGYGCLPCGCREAFELPRRFLWQCKACGHQPSVTAGTALRRTRISLRDWFWAAYLVRIHGPGLSALQLKRELGLTRYETA